MITKQIAWNTGSGNITLTYQGQGDALATVQSDANDGAARSQIITIETTKGSPVVTKNLTIRQGACPVPVGTVLNYAYTGSYQEVELPAGQYKLQCWGAQGGSNAAASSYDITTKAGGKGGYSEGVLTLTAKTTVRIYVGGAGSSSAGGFNGGGSTSGSASYSSGNTSGVSRMGGGGGATDIRLSDGALLSRMIVAGGGSGGAMCYKEETTSTTSWQSVTCSFHSQFGSYYKRYDISGVSGGDYLKIVLSSTNDNPGGYDNIQHGGGQIAKLSQGTNYVTLPNISATFSIYLKDSSTYNFSVSLQVYKQVSSSSTSTSNSSQVGFAGGGTNGVGYSSTYQGKQDAAGSGGSFGQGANQITTNYRFCSGAGGGGWYGGGGGQYSDTSMDTCKYSGGGSGWVNIAANASYRPSGYTGLQLDSGETKAGNTSFPSTSGGTETGHSGNGYARITRIS